MGNAARLCCCEETAARPSSPSAAKVVSHPLVVSESRYIGSCEISTDEPASSSRAPSEQAHPRYGDEDEHSLTNRASLSLPGVSDQQHPRRASFEEPLQDGRSSELHAPESEEGNSITTLDTNPVRHSSRPLGSRGRSQISSSSKRLDNPADCIAVMSNRTSCTSDYELLRDWVVDLRMHPGDKLGIALAAGRGVNLGSLQVTAVMDDGAVARWNETNPGRAIGAGCLIVQVNEHRVDTLRMEDAKDLFLTLPRRMRLLVRRPLAGEL